MTRTPATHLSASAWIKRRARRLVRAFQISRSEAVANAWLDWTHFYRPRTFVGERPMMQNRNDMGGFHVKFERPEKPEIPAATEQSILEMYGAKTARGLVKNLVAMANGKSVNPLEAQTESIRR